MAVVLTAVVFVALVICGFGVISLVSGEDVIATPGLGILPGVVGVAAAVAVYALVTLISLRPAHPTYYAALWAAVACYLAYICGVWLAAVIGGVDSATATAVAGRLAVGWWAPLVAVCAFVSTWSAVALRRTHARRPRWPWEGRT